MFNEGLVYSILLIILLLVYVPDFEAMLKESLSMHVGPQDLMSHV